MKHIFSWLVANAFLALWFCSIHTLNAQVQVKIPTVKQEASSIWRTINAIKFLEKQGYTIHLPNNEVISGLIQKSKKGEFGNSDFQKIYSVLESGIYSTDKYNGADEKVKSEIRLINSLVRKLKRVQHVWNWEFKVFDSYDVVFTLYGTGGSYDPDRGLVTLFTTDKGKFMLYENPANTIIHEIIHMGIEKSIVQKYNLSHQQKERIVDTITYLLFKNDLKSYKIQNMDDCNVDKYLNNEADLKNLSQRVAKCLQEN